jgi:hypothetical protein
MTGTPTKRSKAQKSARPAVRSTKAGAPRADTVAHPRAKRRLRSAHAAYRKDAVVQKSAEGPSRVWGISRPKEKRRRSAGRTAARAEAGGGVPAPRACSPRRQRVAVYSLRGLQSIQPDAPASSIARICARTSAFGVAASLSEDRR